MTAHSDEVRRIVRAILVRHRDILARLAEAEKRERD